MSLSGLVNRPKNAMALFELVKQLYVIIRRRVVIWVDGTHREGIVSLFGLVDRPENVMALFELVEQPFILCVTLLFGPMDHRECVVALFGSVSKQPKSIITLF